MEVPVIAVDIPSGISGENGHMNGSCAWDTVTFGYPKRGHLLYPGRYAGRLHVAKIGLRPTVPKNWGKGFTLNKEEERP